MMITDLLPDKALVKHLKQNFNAIRITESELFPLIMDAFRLILLIQAGVNR